MAEEFEDNDVDASEDPSALVKKLRAELKAAHKESADNKSAQRELGLLKAGIDTSTKLGSLFAKTFEGDIADLEAVKAEWSELSGQVAPAVEPEVTDTSAQERSALASNATPDDGAGVDPREQAIAKANDAMKHGATWESAAGSAISELAAAALHGDQRVIVRGNAY